MPLDAVREVAFLVQLHATWPLPCRRQALHERPHAPSSLCSYFAKVSNGMPARRFGESSAFPASAIGALWAANPPFRIQKVSEKDTCRLNGGEGGIRTHGRVSPTHAFQACSLNRSDTSPGLMCSESVTNQLNSGKSTSEMACAQLQLRAISAKLSCATPGWCNWQHSGLWSRESWFESKPRSQIAISCLDLS